MPRVLFEFLLIQQAMTKYELPLRTPLLNAPGSLGFAPDDHSPVDLSRFGVFITNPVSLHRRSPVKGRRFLEFSGGYLLHTGHPNPGIRMVLNRYSARWARSQIPVMVHLMVENPGELFFMVNELEAVEGMVGIELGLPPEADLDLAVSLVGAALGELPLMVCLPWERALEFAIALSSFDLTAVSLAAPRGALPGPDNSLIQGRLYGPAIFPFALAIVQKLVRTGMPVIAAGGVYGSEHIAAMLATGAVGVQLDGILWRGGW